MLDFKACVKLVCMFLTINKVYCIVFYNTETKLSQTLRGPYSSWIYNYLCNQCLSQLTLRVRIPLRRGVLDTTLCDKI